MFLKLVSLIVCVLHVFFYICVYMTSNMCGSICLLLSRCMREICMCLIARMCECVFVCVCVRVFVCVCVCE